MALPASFNYTVNATRKYGTMDGSLKTVYIMYPTTQWQRYYIYGMDK